MLQVSPMNAIIEKIFFTVRLAAVSCICLALIGCQRLSVKRRYIDESDLASEFVGSPDPLQESAPHGEKLWIYWNLKSEEVKKPLIMTVTVIAKNLDEDVVSYPVNRRKGHVVYSLMNEEYEKKGGILTYKAYLSTAEGIVLDTTKQALWFRPIKMRGD